MSELRRHCTQPEHCGGKWCARGQERGCVYEYVETGGPHDYKGEQWPPPRRWVSADGTHVYRTYADYVDD